MKIEFPGLVDLQVNGFAGVDFNTPGYTAEQYGRAIEAMRASGVTRFLAALITSSLERFASCAAALVDLNDPAIVGIHMEGPYLSPEDGPRGVHPREHVMPASIDDFKRRQEAARGRIVLVTLAPEVPGAVRLIEYLVDSGVRVAIGHTAASSQSVADAIEAGATMSTHLGNGCQQSLPRHPNIIWDQLAADELMASFIADGHHLPPATVKAMIRAKTPGRSILVTDATAAAAAAPGYYTIGETPIELNLLGRVAAAGSGKLAGSSLTLGQAVANVVRFSGLPIEEALAMATERPAAYLGIRPAGVVTADWNVREGKLHILAVRLRTSGD